jgi:6-phosphogluconolactonase
MKTQLKTALWVSAVALLFAACQKETNQLSLQNENLLSSNSEDKVKSVSGHVYTLSNATTGNQVMDYLSSSNGTLTFSASYASGGNGSGGGLGNQSAVTLTNGEKNILLAVNAGSNSISSFKIKNGLHLKSTVSSGGILPVSIAQHNDLVFVVNAGGSNTISGFKLKEDGMLKPIPNSTRSLCTTTSTGPAQISFVNDGKVLVITEKATNKIVTYTVNEDGIPGKMHSITSSTPTPFGFAVGKNGTIFISEAAGGAAGASVLSSYSISDKGVITLIKGSVAAGQSAACWVVITNNGKFAYATNTANDNISKFGITNSGGITVSEAISATTQAGPIDAALSKNSKYLYVLNGGGHSIQAFNVNNDGTLRFLQTVPDLPIGANGLAAN